MSSNFKLIKEAYSQKSDKSNIVAIIDGKTAETLNDFYTQVAKQLQFPSYFAKNLDALYDCLCDFSWLEVNNIHIVLRNYDLFLEKEPRNKRWDVLVVLNDAVNDWKAMKGKDKVKLELHVETSQRIKQDLEDAEV